MTTSTTASTDITRYNAKIDRLLPDVMFEYDEQNRVIQRINGLVDCSRYDTQAARLPDLALCLRCPA